MGHKSTTSALSVTKKLVFGIFAVILFFGGLEIFMRITGFTFQPMTHPGEFGEHFEPTDADSYLRDPHRFWIPFPGKTLNAWWIGENGAAISSFSTRGAEPAVPKPENTVRILCAGDSGTFGWGVNDDQTYSAHLQDFLEKWAVKHSDRQFEVINAGVNGFTTHQALEHARILDHLLNPDIILISTGRNDMTHLQITDEERPVLKPWHLKAAAVTTHSRTGQFIMWLAQRKTAEKMDAAVEDSNQTHIRRVTQDQFQEKITTFIAENLSVKRPLLFLNRGGHFTHVIDKMPLQDGFYPVTLGNLKQLGQVQLFLHGGHPDTDTYRIIAEEIFSTLVRNNILKPYRTR